MYGFQRLGWYLLTGSGHTSVWLGMVWHEWIACKDGLSILRRLEHQKILAFNNQGRKGLGFGLGGKGLYCFLSHEYWITW